MQRKHQRWTVPLACGVLVSVLAVLVPVLSHRNVAATRDEARTVAKSTGRVGVPVGAGAPAAAAAVLHAPRYLPSGARAAPVAFPKAGAPLLAYCLPGRVNSDTMPPGGPTEANYRIVHTPTCIELFYVPAERNGKLPPSLVFGSASIVSQTTVAGHPARLTRPSHGIVGLLRLEWMADGLRFTLSVDRQQTSEGVSGISLDELRRVADSVT